MNSNTKLFLFTLLALTISTAAGVFYSFQSGMDAVTSFEVLIKFSFFFNIFAAVLVLGFAIMGRKRVFQLCNQMVGSEIWPVLRAVSWFYMVTWLVLGAPWFGVFLGVDSAAVATPQGREIYGLFVLSAKQLDYAFGLTLFGIAGVKATFLIDRICSILQKEEIVSYRHSWGGVSDFQR